MLFGLKNAVQTFQRLMDMVKTDLNFVFMSINDISIASKNKKQHLQYLQQLFQRLAEYGLAN